MTQIHVTKSICIEIGGRCLLAGKAHTLEAVSSIEKVSLWVSGGNNLFWLLLQLQIWNYSCSVMQTRKNIRRKQFILSVILFKQSILDVQNTK